MNKIPPLSWASVAELIQEADCVHSELPLERYNHISDPGDRKFAALAEVSGAVLVTSDDDLLSIRDGVSVEILTRGEFWDGQRE